MNAIKATMSVCRAGTFGLIAGGLGMLVSVQAHALSLGGFQVESTLDEPLRAEIQLQSVDSEVLESLEVTLGSPEDFERAAVPRSEFLQQLQFTVSQESGAPVVVVTTDEPIKEPFLHFLISAEWSGGKLVREYTGLLDPPLYVEESPASVETPAVAETQSPSMADPEIADTRADPGADTGTSPSTVTGSTGRAAEYGPTREGDTLWDIASKLDTGPVQANVFQIMIALQRENPVAFIDNNINRLKTGQVLSVSDISLVASVSPDEASAMYAAQLEEWQSSVPQVASADEPAGEMAAEETGDAMAAAETAPDEPAEAGTAADTSAAAQGEAQGEEEDVLKIVQATLEESESETAGAGADRSGEITELRGQIATLEESLESRNLENQELRERVRLLESQLENAQRLIEIESQELAVAQQQAAQAQEQAAEAEAAAAAAETGGDQVAAQTVEPVEEIARQPAETSTTPETQEPAAEAETTTTAQATQESTQEAQQASATATQSAESGQSAEPVRVTSRSSRGSWWSDMTDMLFSSWMWMVGAVIGVVVLVLGLLMFLRRRQSIAEFEESILSGSALDSHTDTTDTAATSASDTSFLSDFGTAGMGTMQADEVDPLAEAEVYLAYGRDEQAEDVLKEAARRDPERAEVKLKLLEIYKQRNDVKSFETIAEELYPAGESGDPEVWAQVTAMGRELNPGNPLFQETGAAAEPAAEADDEAPAAAPETVAASGFASQADTDALDFNLEDLEPAPTRPQAPDLAAAPPQSDDDSDTEDRGLELDTGAAAQSASPASAGAGHGDLDFDDEFLDRASTSVDPATQPFPAPEDQYELDRELERLASERESAVTIARADTGGGDAETPSQELDLAAAADTDTLDFSSSSETPDIDFDLDLDESSIQHLSGTDADADTTPRRDGNGGEQAGDTDEALLEFESADIPPEETWAGASSDATPGGDENSVTYAPSDDVQSAGAPQYNEAETKLDLARAYLDMGDKVGARSIIDEVMREGDPAQRDQAAELAAQL